MFFKKKSKPSKQNVQLQADIDKAMLDRLENSRDEMAFHAAQTNAYLALTRDAAADVFADIHAGAGKKTDAQAVAAVTVKLSNVPPTAGANYHALTEGAAVTLRHMPLKDGYQNVVVFNDNATDLDKIVTFAAFDEADQLIAQYGEGFAIRGEVDSIVRDELPPKSFFDRVAATDHLQPLTDEEYQRVCDLHKNGRYKEVSIRIVE